VTHPRRRQHRQVRRAVLHPPQLVGGRGARGVEMLICGVLIVVRA
jgi:hypothetical protein